MRDAFDLEDHGPAYETRRRPPMLGRMSVFVIGVVLGIVIGVGCGVVGWSLAGSDSERPAFALPGLKTSRPAPKAAAKKTSVTLAAQPSQTLNIAPGKPVIVGVFGDSMGDGLWQGLYRRLEGDKTYRIVRFSQASTGFTRYGYVNVQDHTAEQLSGQHIDVAIICFGANDEQPIADAGQLYPFESDGWRQVYAARIDALVSLLRRQGAAVYWVGLPKMKHAEYDRRAGVLNALYEERARALGVPFVDTVPVTIDPQGAYDDYLVEGGHPRLMRAKDGIHMTPSGYLRLAGPVTELLKSDVAKTLAGAKAASGAAVTLAAGPPAFAPPSP